MFDKNLTSIVVKIFSHLIFSIKTFYKCFTFNAICKDNVPISRIAVKGKIVLIW